MREARGGVSASDFNTPGPKPGDLKAISQHKAIADGYASPETPRMTNTQQAQGKTGGVHAPGLTHRSGAARR